MADDRTGDGGAARFGTFGGVFTPCVLTILGVIMFMRAGYVVGEGGIWLALAVLGLAKLITGLTTLSISAIATNIDMRVGGVYFMISRVLGPDFGGSIGITLYFANAVGVAFYTIGFTEALFSLLGLDSVVAARIVSTVLVAGLFALTFKGADLALKAQYVVLGVLLLAVASFLLGGALSFDGATFEANGATRTGDWGGFWVLFAIFFPAATGITAGANMSGDLKNPTRSIPWGTLLAVLFTAGVYAAQLLLMAGSCEREALVGDGYRALQGMSVFAPLVVAGVFAATLSSALGSFLGAPRILQAMGQDRLMRVLEVFGKGAGPADEPRRATVLTFLIAVAVIWSGDLDAVAEVISMFFLIAYGMINLSAFVESKSLNPSFRPRFRFFHWAAALAGAVGCAVAMVKINETYAMIALAIAGLIYFYLKKREIQTSWGDAKRGYIFQRTRDNLLYLERAAAHPKNWRPILVTLSEEARRDEAMIRVGAWLEGGRGLYTVAQLSERPELPVTGRVAERRAARDELARWLEADGVQAFAEVTVVSELGEGLSAFLQSYSIGGLRPNTAMLAMPPRGDPQRRERFLETLGVVAAFDLNLVVLQPGSLARRGRRRSIDLWWRGERNGSLMALFAYLLTLDREWAGASIRVLRIVRDDDEEREARRHLAALVESIRIPARIEVIRTADSPTEIIAERSGAAADLVLLGMTAASGEEARRFVEQIDPLLHQLPTTLMIWSNGEADVFA